MQRPPRFRLSWSGFVVLLIVGIIIWACLIVGMRELAN